MTVPGRTLKVSSVIAALCIVIYIAAIIYGAFQIFTNIGERRDRAEMEFQDLTDRAASSAVFLGFMSEAYQETIRDFLSASDTLLGIIITGSAGEYAFERYPGSGIVWVGNSPRFKTGFGFPNMYPYMPLTIEGQRNVSIQATYSYIDDNHFLRVLKNSLLAILVSLAIAFITLLFELALKNKPVLSYTEAQKPVKGAGVEKEPVTALPETNTMRKTAIKEPPMENNPFPDDNFSTAKEETASSAIEPDDYSSGDITFEDYSSGNEISMDYPSTKKNSTVDEKPQGLFNPRSNIGWESYTLDRLASEIHRCASFEQDLVFLAMEFRVNEKIGNNLYRQFAEEAINLFAMRDLIFEKGENGISVIIPNSDLEQGMDKSEEFRSRIFAKMPESFEDRTKLCIGLSSRSGRLVEAERLMLETFSALDKAMDDPDSPVIAFKSDPEKYREFVRDNLKA